MLCSPCLPRTVSLKVSSFHWGKRAQLGLNTAEFNGWRVLFFFAWLFFQKTRICIKDFEQCGNETQQLLVEQELPSLLLGEPAAYIMEAQLDSQPLQWNWIGCGWWLHVPTHRRSWLGQGCADQFRARLLSLYMQSPRIRLRAPETTARESDQQETWRKISM